MCYSFESSINAWFYALIGSIILILFARDLRLCIWVSIFTITFTQIQVIEAIAWNNIDNDGSQESLESLYRYIPILLWSQPLVQSLFGYLYSGNLLLLYLSFIFIFIIIIDLQTNDTYSIKVSEQGHLIWVRKRNNKKIFILGGGDGYDNLYKLLYIFGIFAPLFVIKDTLFLVGLVGYGLFSYLYTILNYNIDEFNSMWCYYAVNYITVANIINIIEYL